MKKNIFHEIEKRMTSILKTEFNARNKVKAINSFAIPVILYSFGVLHWVDTDLEAVNRRVWVLTSVCKLPYAALIFWGGKSHPSAVQWRKRSFRCEADKSLSALKLQNRRIDPMTNFVSMMKKKRSMESKCTWSAQAMTILQSHGVDIEASNKWLSTGVLFYETENFLVEIVQVPDCELCNSSQ